MSAKLNTSGKRTQNDEGASEEMRPLCLTEEMLEIYRAEPERFAREVLGSRWWYGQTEIARLLSQHRRVAVKAANGVGKTFLAADIVLWFLYCHRPSVVLTTAPTWRQVESLLWEEIHRRFRRTNALAEMEPGRFVLEGTLLQTRLKVSEGHFAMGLSTDEPVRFQGFHAENLLIVLDEACGVPEEIWDAVEGICVGSNNRVLAITPCLIAVDVARFGSDETVIAMRRGDVVYPLQIRRKQLTTETARQVYEIAIREKADAIFIDEIGVGAGVVDNLRETGIAGVVGVNVSMRPMLGATSEATYLNLRAQIYGTLRDKLVKGEIALPYDETLRAQIATIRYHFATNGKIQMTSKEEMKKHGIGSPDRADAVALLFCPQAEFLSICGAVPITLGERLTMVNWQHAEW